MSRIYKIAYNKNNTIDKVFVFIGDGNVSNLDEEKKNVSALYSGAEIIYVEQWIHLDDSIDTIKKKLIIEWNKKVASASGVTYGDIYCYFKKTEIVNSNIVYEKFSDNGNVSISKDILEPFLINIEYNSSDNGSNCIWNNFKNY